MVWDSAWWANLLEEPWLYRGIDNRNPPWSEFYNMYSTPAKLPILVRRPCQTRRDCMITSSDGILCWVQIGFNSGSSARTSELGSDEEIKAEAMAALASILPKGNVPVSCIVHELDDRTITRSTPILTYAILCPSMYHQSHTNTRMKGSIRGMKGIP